MIIMYVKNLLCLRVLIAALGFWLLETPSAQAQFTYSINNGAVTILGYTGTNTSVIIPSTINGFPVTGIGNAFVSRVFTSVTIPTSVTNIGNNAFYRCTLSNITIPNSVTSIGYEAFAFCTNLSSITIPNSVAYIGVYAFSACSNLISVTIPGSVGTIQYGTFDFCTSLTSAKIANGVTNIGEGVFAGCTSLANIQIPNSVTSIQQQAFVSCSGLTSITIPNSVTSISGFAFSGSGLTSVTIPGTVTNLGEAVFQYCPNLVSATFANGSTSIGNGMFEGCSNLTIVEIPNSVTSIQQQAFVFCSGLTSITIPGGVTNMGDQVFWGCSSLTNVCFEGNAPYAGLDIFLDDTGLTAVHYIVGTSGWGTTFSGVKTAPCAQCSGVLQVTINGHVYCACDGSPITNASVQIGPYSATSDNGGSYIISSVPPGNFPAIVSKSNYYSFTTILTISSGSTTFTQNFSLTPVPALNVNVRRVASVQAIVAASDAIDSPIQPVPLPSALATASPLGLGVVADEVTPVLFQFNGTATNYTISLTHNAQNYTNGPFSTNLFVLQNGAWQQTTNFAISSAGSPGSGTAYAYLQGLRWTDFTGVPAGNQVTVTLTVALTNGSVVASTNFLVRPVPIILVHGIADTGATWSPGFTNALAQNVPADFIIPITYGQGSGTGFPANQLWPSSSSNFLGLAKEVDADLHNVESNLKSNWAFTRYDAVGHSQGGVLLRMLCQTTGVPAFGTFTSDGLPVVSFENFYRGRFRRVVTIGSPQNGSLVCYYLDQMILNQPPSLIPVAQEIADLVSGLVYFNFPAIQKFDPTGWQIKFVNNTAFPVDSRIPFHCVCATINSGLAPNTGPDNPPVYTCLALTNVMHTGANAGYTRGEVLLPAGSDGIVDYVSQGGGIGTPLSYNFNNISHAWPEWFFGVLANNTETASVAVGIHVASLLNGSSVNFGPFILPQPIPQSALNSYSQVVPNILTIVGAIIQGFAAHIPSTNINYHLVVPSNLPLGGPVNWTALDYGTNGISTNWLSVLVNTNDSTQMTLSVNSNVVGQVVISAEYMDTNGDLVFAAPFVALSVPTSSGATLTNIVLQPPTITLAVGDSIPTQIVGKNSDGTQSYIYISPGQVTYVSSNPQIAAVDSGGTITMKAFGKATVFASYNGFSAQAAVSSITPSISYFSGIHNTNGTFQLSFAGTASTTNVIQASTNLINWVPIATLYNTQMVSCNFSMSRRPITRSGFIGL